MINDEEFCHLHVHSSFSMLDGVGSHEEYCQKAKQNHQLYLCITDHGELSGIPSQIRECDKHGLPYILGVEGYIQRMNKPDNTKDLSVEEKKQWRKSHHILLIAYNNVGYQNLVSLTSYAHIYGYHYRPRMNFELLKKYKEGLIVTSCCIMGEVGQAFLSAGEDAAEALVLEYYEAFGENFYLELMMLDYEPQKAFDKFIVKMILKHGIKSILTQDCHYAKQEDHEAQTNLLLVQTKRTREDLEKLIASGNTDMFEVQDKNLWLKSMPELFDFWNKTVYKEIIPEDIFLASMRMTTRICEQAKNVRIDRSIKLPSIDNADEILLEEIKKGFKKRNVPNNEVYRRRVADEFDLLVRKGFASYFLTQQKIVLEARRYCNDILGFSEDNAVGPGRGSAASSLILYLLGVTQVDPIKHDLLFSRFLSESRGRQLDYKFDE